MKTASALALAVLMCFAARATAADDDNAKKLIGKWEITKSSDVPAGTIVEFMKDGKWTVVAKVDGSDFKVTGTYKLAKDKLTIKATIEGNSTEDTATITKLTDDVMELQDDDKDKKITIMKRKK